MSTFRIRATIFRALEFLLHQNTAQAAKIDISNPTPTNVQPMTVIVLESLSDSEPADRVGWDGTAVSTLENGARVMSGWASRQAMCTIISALD